MPDPSLSLGALTKTAVADAAGRLRALEAPQPFGPHAQPDAFQAIGGNGASGRTGAVRLGHNMGSRDWLCTWRGHGQGVDMQGGEGFEMEMEMKMEMEMDARHPALRFAKCLSLGCSMPDSVIRLPIGDSCIQDTVRLDGLELQTAHMHSTPSRRLKRPWFMYKASGGPIEPESAPSLGAPALHLQLQTRHALAKSCIFCIGTT